MPKTFLDFSLTQTLGCGTFGKVKKAVHLPTGQSVAIKLLHKNKISNKKDLQRIEREIAILKELNHPNLIQLYQVEQSAKTHYLITELLEGEELFQKINRLGKLDEQIAGSYFAQLLDAVIYLRKRGICHRDIKPQNIIVRGKDLKLIDFGLGNFFKEGELLQTSCGSPCYAAPQMMSEKQYDPLKTEVWALGITLYAMLTGRLPFQHQNTNKLYKLMEMNEFEDLQGVSSSLKSLQRAMIEARPNLRISLEQIQDHIWIKSLKHNFYEQRNQQWNQKVLKDMQKQTTQSVNQLKQSIKHSFGKDRTLYYLSLKKQEEYPSDCPYPFHQGPVHLSFLFASLKAIKQEIQNQMPHAQWVSLSCAKSLKQSAVIKKMFGSQMYYLCIEPIQ